MVRKSVGLFCFAASLVVAAPVILGEPALALDRKYLQDCNQTIDPERSIAGCTRALESPRLSNRVRVDAYFHRGFAHNAKGAFDLAIGDLTEAVRIDPNFANGHVSLGFAHSGKGDYDLANIDFSEAIRIDPKSAVAYSNRGWLYGQKGDYDRAFAESDEAIRIDPAFVNAYVIRADLFNRKGDYGRAIADCASAIRLDSKNADAYGALGDAYRVGGEVERAIASYNQAIGLHPNDAELLTGRGLVYERMSDIVKARADYNAALLVPQPTKYGRTVQDKARARLAALSDTPHSTMPGASAPATTVVATSSAPIAVNDRRIALVIGNAAYENVPALANPVRDANFVAETLKRTGFESVTIQTNLRKEALITALRDFAVRAESADWAVVYYAGHGMEVGGINYLIPTDAKIAADRDIGFEAVPMQQVLNAAERAKKLRLVILDACRDNPFASQMKRTLTVASRSVSHGLAAVEPDAGTLVVYAAKDGETAIDGEGGNSPFALAFVKNLQTPGLEVRRLFDYVRDDVMEATSRKQKPFSYGSISGRQDFYFVAGK